MTTVNVNTFEAWLDGILHFPPLETNKFRPSSEICDGRTLSKNGFKIWAHIKSLHDKAITSNASAILPFLLLKNARNYF